jgi:hypothetical protein
MLGAYSINNINGLGSSGWNQLRADGFSAPATKHRCATSASAETSRLKSAI